MRDWTFTKTNGWQPAEADVSFPGDQDGDLDAAMAAAGWHHEDDFGVPHGSSLWLELYGHADGRRLVHVCDPVRWHVVQVPTLPDLLGLLAELLPIIRDIRALERDADQVELESAARRREQRAGAARASARPPAASRDAAESDPAPAPTPSLAETLGQCQAALAEAVEILTAPPPAWLRPLVEGTQRALAAAGTSEPSVKATVLSVASRGKSSGLFGAEPTGPYLERR